jgi:glyoxylase-like metal-dependent hydrolase (beta-lactamase superfamily II)
VEAVREAGIDVWVREEDAHHLPSYDHTLDDDAVHRIGELRLRTIHTPGHTPGSISFALEGTPLLFTGDTLFPGGPGNTSFEGGDFPTIIRSIEERLFRPYGPETLIWPGHGAPSTLATEMPHLDEWVERGW